MEIPILSSYSYFAYTFAPRTIDHWVYGLNSGNDMDLLTVVMHELGHVLGLEDLDPDTHDLMSEALDAGVRGICLPDPSRPCRCIVMMR